MQQKLTPIFRITTEHGRLFRRCYNERNTWHSKRDTRDPML